MRVTGLVLAGGRSRRFGRDKAAVRLADGRTLLEHQVARLRCAGAAEVLVARRPDQPATPGGARPVFDVLPDRGPLAGLVAGFAAMRGDLLLAVAVDLPDLEAALLRRLLEAASPGRGAIAVTHRGPEPLVAAYPRSAGALAAEHLAAGRLAVRAWVARCLGRGELVPWTVPERWQDQLRNWNTPADVAAVTAP